MSMPFYLLLVGNDVNSNDLGRTVVIGSTGSTPEVENCLGDISFFSVTTAMKYKI